MESKRQHKTLVPLQRLPYVYPHTPIHSSPAHPIISKSSPFYRTQFQIHERSYQEAMRNQNLKTPSLQSKSKKPTYSAESDASFSISKNNKSVPKAITIHQSRQPPLLPDARTDGTVAPARSGEESGGCCGRERLKRHWLEVAGRVWIPDIWGQEDLLKDWIDCSSFDSSLVGSSIMSARESLVKEGQRASSTRIRIENSC